MYSQERVDHHLSRTSQTGEGLEGHEDCSPKILGQSPDVVEGSRTASQTQRPVDQNRRFRAGPPAEVRSLSTGSPAIGAGVPASPCSLRTKGSHGEGARKGRKTRLWKFSESSCKIWKRFRTCSPFCKATWQGFLSWEVFDQFLGKQPLDRCTEDCQLEAVSHAGSLWKMLLPP